METGEQQAQAQLESVVEIIAALRAASNDEAREAAQIRIQKDPLSIEVRGDWHAPGGEGAKPGEFMILLAQAVPQCESAASWIVAARRRIRALNIKIGLRLGGNCWT